MDSRVRRLSLRFQGEAMQHRNLVLIAALAGCLTAVLAFSSSPGGQTPAHPVASQDHGSPAHKAAPSAAQHSSSPAALTRIEILPASVSMIGPRYSQRLLVEGTDRKSVV